MDYIREKEICQRVLHTLGWGEQSYLYIWKYCICFKTISIELMQYHQQGRRWDKEEHDPHSSISIVVVVVFGVAAVIVVVVAIVVVKDSLK